MSFTKRREIVLAVIKFGLVPTPDYRECFPDLRGTMMMFGDPSGPKSKGESWDYKYNIYWQKARLVKVAIPDNAEYHVASDSPFLSYHDASGNLRVLKAGEVWAYAVEKQDGFAIIDANDDPRDILPHATSDEDSHLYQPIGTQVAA